MLSDDLIKNLQLLKKDGILFLPKYTPATQEKIGLAKTEYHTTVKTSENIAITKADKMAQLQEQIKNCQNCKLSSLRTNIVFGEGNLNAELFFVGEAPGENEDLQGKPFVGKAGILLTKIINAMNLSREEVYIGNIIKCRPPKNRDPENDEIDACINIILAQIDIIKPKIICTLGRVSSKTLLATDEKISKLRGKFYDFRGIKLMPTFHPAHLLHHPESKKPVWEDMQMIMKELSIPLKK